MEKVALIVGAGDATGGAIARRFARGGYTVCATRRNLDKLQPLLDAIVAEGTARFGTPDVAIVHRLGELAVREPHTSGGVTSPAAATILPQRNALCTDC